MDGGAFSAETSPVPPHCHCLPRLLVLPRVGLVRGIRFINLRQSMNDEQLVGTLLVLDTRPRRMSEREKESLHTAAAASLEALELRAVALPVESEQSGPT
jgi:hypothetical protein